MRAVVRLGAAVLVAGAVTALPADAPPDRALATARAVMGEHPEMWAGASLVRGQHALVIGGRTAADPRSASRSLSAPGARPEVRSGSVPVAGLAAVADSARRTVARVWGSVDAVILVPATDAQAAVLASPAGVTGLAALADVDHVIVAPSGFARLSETGRRVVLAHELTHVATGAAVAGDMPAWLVEGFADYVGYLDSGLTARAVASELAAEVRAGTLPAALPGREAFRPGSVRLPQAYEEAWLACRYIAERYGERALVALYRAASDHDLATALVKTLGTNLAELTAAWREYVRSELA
ncbi:peptidase MA family metallohydrolase [Microtetraspora glauca]|uniref:Peptidase MA-like domain-containing protein n=1 Tax=Microtetraspora glauca TaxID=1996 RepID=A0ABV3GBQ8_MICGL